jgi:hypothetical protein
MRAINGFFEKLYFSESELGKACLDGAQLRVSVSGLFLLGGHPLEGEGCGPYEGELIFDGVADSRRTITEFVGNSRKPDGFKPPREVVDEISFEAPVEDTLQEFGFDGYQESPSAWIDNWLVRAKSFELRIEPSSQTH